MQKASEQADLTGLTVEIVSAFVSNNRVGPSELPVIIESVHQSLKASVAALASDLLDSGPPLTSAQIRRSVRPDHLVSFEDGKRYRTLARPLSKLGLTPSAYRAKWGLPCDYPTTAPAYSAWRSETATRWWPG